MAYATSSCPSNCHCTHAYWEGLWFSAFRVEWCSLCMVSITIWRSLLCHGMALADLLHGSFQQSSNTSFPEWHYCVCLCNLQGGLFAMSCWSLGHHAVTGPFVQGSCLALMPKRAWIRHGCCCTAVCTSAMLWGCVTHPDSLAEPGHHGMSSACWYRQRSSCSQQWFALT